MRSLITILGFAFALASTPALAQPKDEPAKDAPAADEKGDSSGDAARPAKRRGKKERPKEKLFDFTALKLDGSTRMPQLLYFLERASAELERASLKRRSFVPEMVRSMDEDAL